MKLNTKFHALVTLPLILVLALVYIANAKQYQRLSKQATQVYREGLISTRKTELRHLVQVARGAIAHVYNDPTLSEADAKAQVKAILNDMLFGKDGYYFAYNYDGINQVLPGQPLRVGTNMITLEDVNGVMIIEELINNAKDGGDYVEYIFHQPSKGGELGKKLSYSEAFEKWDWMIGTGVYIDDIDEQTASLNNSLTGHINKAAQLTLLIGMFAVLIIFSSGAYVRFSENRSANRKLRALNKRIFQTQEEERQRVARELHDGVSQTIASAKFSLETAQLKYGEGIDIQADMDAVKSVISQVMGDIRGISHQLHPGVLEDHGLGAALEELGKEFEKRSGIRVTVKRLKVSNILSMEIKTALYRVAQEAMSNIERHAKATHVAISLEVNQQGLTLEIKDNGLGFNYKNSQKLSEGIGLRNMKERLSYHHGTLAVDASEKGTVIQARVPHSQITYHDQSTQHNNNTAAEGSL